MSSLLTHLLAATVLLAGSFAHAAPPSQAQIDELLEVTRVRESITSMLPQIQVSQQQMIQRMMAGKELSTEEQHIIDAMVAASMNAVTGILSWEQLQPLYRDLYAQTFDAEEVQAMTDFYASPAGQSMVKKMPLLTQNAMQAVQEKLLPFLQELQHNLETHADGHAH